MDVLEIDGASNNGVEQVRELRDNVKYAPSRCRYKIYYIDEVHMLTTGAFNALLKTLEEPPEHVKFIFATTEPNKILPTIISRCQRFDLRRIPNAVIAKHLLHIAKLENVNLDEKAAYAIGKGAEGGMRDAQSMLDQLVAFCGGQITEQDVLDVFGFTSGEAVAALARHILESDTVGALRAVYEQNEAGKELGRFLGDLIQHFRTLLVQQADPEAAAEDLSPEVAEEVVAQAQMASTEQLLRVVDGLADVDARMRWASNKRLHFELAVIAAVQSLNEVSISDVIDALDSGSAEGLARPAPRVQAAPPPLRRAAEPVRAAPLVKTEPVVQEEAPKPAPAVVKAPEPEPQPVVKAPQPEAKPVEKAPAPVAEKAPEPKPVVAAKVEASPVQEPGELFSEDVFWSKFVHQVQVRRPLAVSWLHSATLMGIARNTIKVGFPPSESFARDSLMRPAQISFLEGLAQELIGQAVKFEFVLDSSLKAPAFAEIDLGLLNEPAPAPAPKPAAEPKVEAKAASQAELPKAAAPESAAPQPPEDFYNDPLIQQAMVKFKAKLVPAG
jgi:DNA polymerase-3 subunit gamma/tau